MVRKFLPSGSLLSYLIQVYLRLFSKHWCLQDLHERLNSICITIPFL
nr:MAG TPA: hypothetical protein [Caudoviricetes sp.]